MKKKEIITIFFRFYHLKSFRKSYENMYCALYYSVSLIISDDGLKFFSLKGLIINKLTDLSLHLDLHIHKLG